MSPLARVGHTVDRLVQAVAVAALVVMMLHTVANAVLRYLARSPLTGTSEYVAFWYLPLAVFLGFHLAQRDRSHIEARLVFDRLPAASQVEIRAVGQVMAALLAFAFAYFGWGEALDAAEVGLATAVVGIPVWPVMFVVPVAFTLFGVQLVLDAVAVVRRRDPDAGAGARGAERG